MSDVGTRANSMWQDSVVETANQWCLSATGMLSDANYVYWLITCKLAETVGAEFVRKDFASEAMTLRLGLLVHSSTYTLVIIASSIDLSVHCL